MQMTVEDGTPGEGFDDGSGDRLQGSLTALSRLCTGRVPLEDVLTQVATFAVAAIPHADGAGLTLLEPNRADTIVATAPSSPRSTPSSTAWVTDRASALPRRGRR